MDRLQLRSSARNPPRGKGEILGKVEALDAEAAKATAAVQFNLDEIRRNRIMVQELAYVRLASFDRLQPTGGYPAAEDAAKGSSFFQR